MPPHEPRLGALLHYVADTFTSVHNSFNDMSVKDHLAYEMKLHDHLMERLSSPHSVTSLTIPYSLICHLKEMHRDYSAHEPSVENDVEHIIRSCATILFWALRCLSTEEETDLTPHSDHSRYLSAISRMPSSTRVSSPL